MRAIDFQAADRRIQELIRRDRLPNVSVCVSGPDGVIFEKGYGYRDRDFTLPVDPDTVFGIASMSKSITALAIAILECEGKLSYDDPVSKYFPDFSVPGAPKDMVTLRTLARHTAGIPPMEPLEWSIAMNSLGRDSEWIRNMRASAPNPMEWPRHSASFQICISALRNLEKNFLSKRNCTGSAAKNSERHIRIL